MADWGLWTPNPEGPLNFWFTRRNARRIEPLGGLEGGYRNS